MTGIAIAGSNFSGLSGSYNGKSFRRVWWNSYQSRWDGLISDSTSDHFIMEDVGGAENFTSLELEDRGSARPTIYWDDANKNLYVASQHGSTCEFWIMNYNDGTDTYSFGEGSAGSGTSIPGMNESTNNVGIISLTVTPNQDAWVFILTSSGGLLMQHWDFSGSSFETGATQITASNTHGCTDCSWFEDGGTNYVCVYGAENAGTPPRDQHFFFIDEDDSSVTTPGNWTDESSSLPAPDGSATIDNHCCMTKDSNENIYIAFKTDATSEDDLKLSKRTPSGTWSGTFEIWNSSFSQSRPAIAIKKKDGSNDEEIIAFANDVNSSQTVHYKVSDLDTISFGGGLGTVMFEDDVGSDLINNGTVPQSDRVLDSDSGVLIVAHNNSETALWQNSLSITEPSGGGVQPTNFYNLLLAS